VLARGPDRPAPSHLTANTPARCGSETWKRNVSYKNLICNSCLNVHVQVGFHPDGSSAGSQVAAPPPPPFVLSGHAASFTPY
jgi:hypothetical protein